jgi:prepilin-type N-terminal cleavage/methylation domain-containing protein
MILQIGKRKNNGLTLIELLLVLILIGIIAGLTVGHYRASAQAWQAKSLVDDVAYLMRYAQSRAVIKHQRHYLQFDENFKSFQLMYQDGEERKAVSHHLGRKKNIPEDITIESPREKIAFYQNGTIDKLRIFFCRKDQCFTVSTQDRPGRVIVAQGRLE